MNINNKQKDNTMTNLNTADRADLEIAILEAGIEETVFGGLDAIIAMETEVVREKLIDYVIENNDFTC